MARLGHMDRDASLEYAHVQNRALERAKQLIESERQEILLVANETSPQSEGYRVSTVVGRGFRGSPIEVGCADGHLFGRCKLQKILIRSNRLRVQTIVTKALLANRRESG